jgi:hypothetical protein
MIDYRPYNSGTYQRPDTYPACEKKIYDPDSVAQNDAFLQKLHIFVFDYFIYSF